jgi:hypothetical protein
MCHHWEIAEADELEEYDVSLRELLGEPPAEPHDDAPAEGEVDAEEEEPAVEPTPSPADD